MTDLSERELAALQVLARKKDHQDVPFINIADARSLTERGLAQRSQEGWDITPEGSAELARRFGPPA